MNVKIILLLMLRSVFINLQMKKSVFVILSNHQISFEDNGKQLTYLNNYYLTLENVNKLVTALLGSAVTLDGIVYYFVDYYDCM